MKLWINALKAELIKLKRGCFYWVHVLIPLAGAIIVALYYWMSAMDIENTFILYVTLVAAAFPFCIAMVTAINFRIEEDNNFYQLLSATNRNSVLLAKLTVLFTMGCLSTALALILFTVLIGRCYSFKLFLQLFIVICITNVILYMIHSFLFLRFGKTVSIFTGICGTLVGLVFLTGLGDGIWKYVPWSMGTRGTNLLILLSTKSLNNYAHQKPILLSDISGLPLICIIEIIIVAGLFMLWFSKWEGRKVFD